MAQARTYYSLGNTKTVIFDDDTNNRVEHVQKGDELSSSQFVQVPTPNYNRPTGSQTNPTTSTSDNPIVIIPSDPRIQIGVRRYDLPPNVGNSILNYNQGSCTSEEDYISQSSSLSMSQTYNRERLPHSPNSSFKLRKQGQAPTPEKMDTNQNDSGTMGDNQAFIKPRKFSANFEKLVREKASKTITKTSNKFQALTEDSDSEYEDDVDRIVKRKRLTGARNETRKTDVPSKKTEETIESIQIFLFSLCCFLILLCQ